MDSQKLMHCCNEPNAESPLAGVVLYLASRIAFSVHLVDGGSRSGLGLVLQCPTMASKYMRTPQDSSAREERHGKAVYIEHIPNTFTVVPRSHDLDPWL